MKNDLKNYFLASVGADINGNVKKPTKLELLKKEYNAFSGQWLATHSISRPPSFTSWKQNYRNT